MSRRRIIAVVTLALAAILAALVAAPAQALPNNGHDRTYFSSAAKTTEVGERIILCCYPGCSGTQLWGTTSAYWTDYWYPCN